MARSCSSHSILVELYQGQCRQGLSGHAPQGILAWVPYAIAGIVHKPFRETPAGYRGPDTPERLRDPTVSPAPGRASVTLFKMAFYVH